MIHLRDEVAQNHFPEWLKHLEGVKDVAFVSIDADVNTTEETLELNLDDALRELKGMIRQ